ncbi:MAG: M56 family metallopeptidase [Bdellovibrionales bacterium]
MSFLNLYVLLNLVLSVAAVTSMGLCRFLKWKNDKVSSAQILILNYVLLLTSSISFLTTFFFSGEEISSPMPQQFSSKVIELKGGVETVFTESSKVLMPDFTMNYSLIIGFVLLGVILFKFIQLFLEVGKTLNSFKESLLFKKNGRLSVYLSSRYPIPYAFSFLGKSFVSLPETLIEDGKLFKIALKHEIQHIRNGDTAIAILVEVMKVIFFLNWPVRKWLDVISLEQEFSCDETLILKRGVLELEYKKCLLKVANFGRSIDTNLVGATRFIFSDSRSELSRRIQKMSKIKTKISKGSMVLLITAFMSVVSMSAYTFKVHASIGGLSMAEVRSLVKKKDFSKDFPVDINKNVVKWVNKYARTQKGGEYTKKALSNYYGYKDLVDKHIKDYGHPKELAAVPFV